MRWSLLLVIATLGGCNWICGKVAETAFEQASGVEVDKDGTKLTFKTPEGEVTVTQTGDTDKKGRMVVSDGTGKKLVMEGGDDKMKITTQNGVMEYGRNTKAPKDFPLPVIDNTSILMSTHHSDKRSEVFSLTLKTPKSAPDVAQFYATELKAKGFSVTQSDVSGGQGSMTGVSGRKHKIRVQITAMQNHKTPGTSVSLTWEKRLTK